MKRLLVALIAAAMLVALAAAPALAQSSKVRVTDVSPDGGSADVGAGSNVTAAFNLRMAKSTINNKTFYLKQQGSSTSVPAQVTYRGTTKTATLNPNNALASGASYTAYVEGGRKGVRGAGGQTLGGTTDGTAAFANAKVSWTFTVATPPETTIASGPPSLDNSRTASFSFSSSAANSSFECSLDGAPFASCTSPKTVPDEGSLADGEHIFEVKATDALGNTDLTSASSTWTVDATAPRVTSVTPADAATSVAPSANGTATFSEAMDETSVENPGAFTLKLGSSTVAATASYDSSTRQATLDPSTDLAWNTTYTATITTGVKDAAGNTLAQERSWTFTTKSTIEATPSTVGFVVANCPEEPSPVRNVTLKNTGTGLITIFPSISGPNASSFSVPTDSITLAPGDTAVVAVTFKQWPGQGTWKGSLDLKDANGNTVHTVPLTGIVKPCLDG